MRRWLAAGLAVACVAVAVLLVARPFRSKAHDSTSGNTVATSLATVEQRSLSSQTQVAGTLGYSGSYAVVNQASGAYTWLPGTGAVVRPGHVLYRVDGKPVFLLRGHTPAYRALSQGTSGADVRQLNASLVELGYATRAQVDPTSDEFGAATRYALERLQHHFGIDETGALALGAAVFLPHAVRITSVSATLGGPAAPGPMARATSTVREVVVSLDANRQGDIRAGDRVDITLADGSITRGVVSRVGRVATASSADSGATPGSNPSPTVDVYVRPLHPAATGRLDQAPVQVAITTSTVHGALVVPVAALLASAAGGY
ncbi:MAG: Peptidoglycan-binding domain 1 protein, partial [Solirubrobacterales bacterium]|nr:Peptidoglycan-binding domain 1 protein [Solirubrobacterales bacterium]